MNDSRVMNNEIISEEIKVSADEIKISLIKNVNMKGEYKWILKNTLKEILIK
ncbi:MAG: hypothetical protein ACLTXO_14435 [Fusobacterium varium]|uniref:hypothetical protein n=1 Tax=Fusobacterium varium TaxID=856 RepID=UPI0039947F1E